jgi:uncharacterized protein
MGDDAAAERRGTEGSTFAERYGPWALIAGASEGVGLAFARAMGERGINVVLLSRRQAVLDEVAADLGARFGIETRTLAIDLTAPDAVDQVVEGTKDLELGMFMYTAGADPNFAPFLESPLDAATSIVTRNCLVPLQLCHHLAGPMVERGRGGIIVVSSGAALVGARRMVAYGASKAFDMVMTEALWAELHDKGVDVLGLILGKTNTPALRQLEHARGLLASPDDVPPDAASVEEVIAEAFENLTNGPTWFVGEQLRNASQMMAALTRNQIVELMTRMAAAAMGPE